MKKDINISNVIISIIMLAVGIILVMNSEDIKNAMSWIVGIIIILISIIKTISLFNDKVLDTTSLAFNILLTIFGVLLISFPTILDVVIKAVFGCWILFAGVKRLIMAIAISRVDSQSYKTFLISSILMLILGGLVLINLFSLLGWFLILYAIMEIINYIYFMIRRNSFAVIFNKEEYDKQVKKNKKSRVPAKMKNTKAIEAEIEE